VDSAVDANSIVTEIFADRKKYESIALMNRRIIEHWSDYYEGQVDHFIKENF